MKPTASANAKSHRKCSVRGPVRLLTSWLAWQYRLQVSLAEQAQGNREANDRVYQSVANHHRAGRRSGSKGRESERANQRGLHLKRGAAPERLAGHDDARQHADRRYALVVGERVELLDPTTEKSQTVKSESDD